MYDKEKMNKMDKKLIIIGIAALLLAVGFSGCEQQSIEKEEPESSTVTINANPSAGIIPLTVSFTSSCDDTDSKIISYHWDFGDGNTSTETNPTHTFQNYGTYTVILTTTDGNTTNSDSISIHIQTEDAQFRSWIKSTFSDIAWHMEQRLNAHIDAIGSGDYEMHKYWAEREKKQYEEALLELDDFKLSSSCESIRDDLGLAFENYIIAMACYMRGDRSTGGYYEDIGTDYAEEAARKLG